MADVGQGEDGEKAREKAVKLGAKKVRRAPIVCEHEYTRCASARTVHACHTANEHSVRVRFLLTTTATPSSVGRSRSRTHTGLH